MSIFLLNCSFTNWYLIRDGNRNYRSLSTYKSRDINLKRLIKSYLIKMDGVKCYKDKQTVHIYLLTRHATSNKLVLKALLKFNILDMCYFYI